LDRKLTVIIVGEIPVKNKKRIHPLRSGLIVGAGAFFLSIVFNLGSQFILDFVGSTVLKFVLLVIIILIGVFFDIIGVAAAAATEGPVHAQAATRKFGAKQAFKVVRNADRVSSFCNDVVGDICGILSGAIAAAIVFELISKSSGTEELVASTLLTALVAGLTVGGKAAGKSMAIAHANDIVLRVGMLLAVVENTTGIYLFGGGGKKKGRKR